jgi:hypothetical protein
MISALTSGFERTGEGPELDPVLSAGQVREVQEMVAIGFAFVLGAVFVSVLFDLLRVDRLFAASGSGAGEDRPFVVADQRDQASQGGCVSVPFHSYVKPAAGVDPCSASVDRIDRVFDLFQSIAASQLRADKLAAFAVHRFWSDAAVAFGSPTFGQPGDLVSAVVRSDRRRVAVGQGGFEFNTEGNLVGVHQVVLFCVLGSHHSLRVTHMSHAFPRTSSQEKQLFAGFSHVYSGHPWATCLARVASEKRATKDADMTQPRDSSRPLATVAKSQKVRQS